MARQRSVSVCALNIRLHPHTEASYVQLMRDIFSLKSAIGVRGDQHLLLSALVKQKPWEDAPDGAEVFLAGAVARFTEIDTSLPWFNADKFDQADHEDMENINIPDVLKPNFTPFQYLFLPYKHLFIFETYSGGRTLSPNAVWILISALCEDKKIKGKYGEVAVDIVAAHESLEKILGISRLKSVKIRVSKPNADVLDLERKMEQRLEAMHAKVIEQKIEAVSGQSLTLDDDTQALAEVALRNGEVEASGTDDTGKFVRRSSKDHPKVETTKFDSDEMTGSQAFMKAAQTLARGRQRLPR